MSRDRALALTRYYLRMTSAYAAIIDLQEIYLVTNLPNQLRSTAGRHSRARVHITI